MILPIGIVAGVVVGFFTVWGVGLLVGWDVIAATEVVWFWTEDGRLTADETHDVATAEDSSRVTSEALLLFASVLSLAATGVALFRAGNEQGLAKGGLTALGIGTVLASWTLVHTVFTMRYAHAYYTPPIGGIDFKSKDRPDYRDFAYMAFTIGMTFQVSDTDVQTHTIRRFVLGHALLSYLFGAVIVASMVNVVASLAH